MARGLPDISPPSRSPRRASFTAAYYGRCGICQDQIEPGDECHYVDDEVCHKDCEE